MPKTYHQKRPKIGLQTPAKAAAQKMPITMDNINRYILAMLDDAMQNHPEFAHEFAHDYNIVEAKKGVFDDEVRAIGRNVLHFISE